VLFCGLFGGIELSFYSRKSGAIATMFTGLILAIFAIFNINFPEQYKLFSINLVFLASAVILILVYIDHRFEELENKNKND